MQHAYLVGINAYPQFPLRGCVNDVNDVAVLLTASFGFAADNIAILKDAEATHDRVEQLLHDLVVRASSGDRILFHYSGHGTQMVVDNEIVDAICPVDCDFKSSDNLTSTKLAKIFASLPQEAHFTWVSDSCYAGGLRAIAGTRRNRYWPPAPEMQARINELLVSAQARLRTFASTIQSNCVFAAACGAEEGAEDANIENRYNGAFTHYLVKQLATEPSSWLSDVCETVSTQLRMAGFAQTPQLKGIPELVHTPFLG